MPPWAIVAQVQSGLRSGNPWKGYAIALGGGMPFSTIRLAFVFAWWTTSTLRTARRSTEVEEADLLAAGGSIKPKTGAPSVPTLGYSASERVL